MTSAERVEALLAGLTLEERLRQRPVREWLDVLGLSLPTVYRMIAEGRLGCLKFDGKVRKGGRGRAGKVMLCWETVAPFLADRWVEPRRVEGRG